MKKFLLSIFAVMLAVFSVQAEEVTFTFKDLYGSSTLSSIESKTVDGITISYSKNDAQNPPAYNKDGTLRLYYASSGNGGSAIFTTDGTKKITAAVITAYSATYTPAVKYCVDGGSSVSGTWSNSVMTISNIEASNTLMIQNANTSNTQLRIKSIVLTVESTAGEGGETPEPEQPETPEAPAAPTLTASCNFDGSMNVAITNIAEDATAYYTTDGTTPSATNGTEYTGSFEITATTTVKAIAVNEGGASDVVSATYTKNEPVTPPAEGEAVDKLTRETTCVTSGSTNYTSWSGKTATSTAVYAGNSAGSNDAIQLRSSNSNSGVVTTKSGGKAKKVVVEWQSSTANGRTLNVYGKNSAYTAATDLYNSSKQGNLLGTIVKGTSTELEIVGDYEYIGLRSNSGAMYLTSVSITWDASAGVTPVAPNAPVLTESQSFSGSMTVTITSDATVYYTTDGTTPSATNGTEYTAPFEITATTTVKAVAVNEVGESDVAEATYKYLEPIDLSDCTVAEAIEAFKNGQTDEATITGYIVGAADGALNKAQFTSETSVESNILIADNADEENVDNCMPIKMANGTAVRNALNLGGNKNVYKKKVVIVGKLEAYFGVAGMQDVEKAGLYWAVSDAGYATLYLGYKAEIPSTVNAYIVESTNSTHAIMKEVEGIVAANTGLILEGEGEHLFNITSSAATANVTGNLLKGSVVDENITEDAYVLSVGANGVGLYGAILNQLDGTAWLNNANKAYLPMSAVSNKSAQFFGFDWEGTTGIENVEVENEVKAIFDLTGRRVEAITAPGIYIVDGVKRVVR